MTLAVWLRAMLSAAALTGVGTMLIVLPWLPDWNQNFFSSSNREWYAIWMNPYFRGAVSGVGVVNLFVSFMEIYHLLRGDGRRAPDGETFAGPPQSG